MYGRVLSVLVALFFSLQGVSLYAAELININTADSEALQTLSGIGPAKASDIIDYRTTTGLFAATVDIMNIKGIGEATYANIKDHITVSGGVSSIPADEGEEGSGVNVSSNENTSSSKSGSGEKIEHVTSLRIVAPANAHVNQPIAFDVVPGGKQDRLVRYRWAFGDGTAEESKTPTHVYRYPGKYVVVVESYYAKRTMVARREITVLPTNLSMSRALNGDLQIHNDASYEIDISGFRLTGDTMFEIPEYTIVLSGATLTIPRSQVESGAQKMVLLTDPQSETVALHTPGWFGAQDTSVNPAPSATGRVAGVQSGETQDSMAFVSEDASISASDVPSITTEARDGQSRMSQIESIKTASVWPYVGLVGVMTLGILGLYVRPQRRKEDASRDVVEDEEIFDDN